MATLTNLTQTQIKNLLDYDPNTGIFTWKIGGVEAGIFDEAGYRIIRINRQRYKAHRLAWLYMTGIWPIHDIDHINNQKGDNIWSNLRAATRSENICNTKIIKTNTSGYKNIWVRSWGYRVAIKKDGMRYMQSFSDLNEAISWRDQKLVELHGSFANFG
jgi:hypothetical protein